MILSGDGAHGNDKTVLISAIEAQSKDVPINERKDVKPQVTDYTLQRKKISTRSPNGDESHV